MGMPQRLRCHHADGIIRFLHLAADFQKFRTDGFQMLGDNVLYGHVTLRYCSRKHKRSGFYLVGDNRIFASMELRHALDTDDIRTGAFNVRTHTV